MSEALARHWSVLASAWSIDREESRTRKRSEETEFLPAALEVIETPASPLGRALLWLLIALLGVALVWSFIGRLDVVAVAPGRVMPTDRVKLIQPSELGTVRRVHVRDGQQVRRGQLLVELDPTLSGADDAQAARGLMVAGIDRARARAILGHMAGRGGGFAAPPDTPREVAAIQRDLVRNQIAEYEARRAAMAQERAEHVAERAVATAEQAKMAETLPLLEKQVQARRTLVERGFGSRLQLYQIEEELIERRRNVEVQAANAARAEAAIAGAEQQLGQVRAEFARDASIKLAEAEDNVSLRTEELVKSRRRQALQRLTAPVDGTVQGLSVHTLGGVVQPADKLMLVVPSRGGLFVEARVLNKDAGFVRAGQPVRVKVEAFPFTKHGVADGVVEHVSRDAEEDDKLGLVYVAQVRLIRPQLGPDGRGEALGAGMAVTAEIRTASRRVIDYLLSPIARTVDEAGRER